MQHMEHSPFYSLSKKPELRCAVMSTAGTGLRSRQASRDLRRSMTKTSSFIRISQVMAKLKAGEPISPRVRINSRDLLIFTNRGTSGKDYQALQEAFSRLAGTRIGTNIRSGKEEQYEGFGLIHAPSFLSSVWVSPSKLRGPNTGFEAKLARVSIVRTDAIGACGPERDYFRLRKPLERRIYEIARKHCGQQKEWRIGLLTLLNKSGSESPEKRFRQMIRHLAEHDHLPELQRFR